MQVNTTKYPSSREPVVSVPFSPELEIDYLRHKPRLDVVRWKGMLLVSEAPESVIKNQTKKLLLRED